MLVRWRSFCRALAFGAAALLSAPGATVRADGDPEPPGETDRVVKIGPQAVVIVDEYGNVRMYDDPSQQAPACKNRADCWGKALSIFGVFGLSTYEDVTRGVEGSGTVIERQGGAP
jgi:hypothetical protein